PPDRAQAHAGHALPKHFPIDQPVGLGIAAYYCGRERVLQHGLAFLLGSPVGWCDRTSDHTREGRCRRAARTSSAIIPPMFLIGIDVGGTFTDLTAIDETSGRAVVTKVPSERHREAAAVLAGLAALGIKSADVRRVVHGTTVGTNAVLERRGARVAVLT